MSKKYQNLLSPIKVGNIVFKNRLTAAPSKPHFLQGPEPYPTEAVITHFANKAKNGAALVTCSGVSAGHFTFEKEPKQYLASRAMRGHFDSFNMYEPHCQHMLSQLTEAIHFYGAKASMEIGAEVPEQYDVSTGIPSIAVFGDGGISRVGKEIPAEMLDGIADDFALQAAVMKEVGFDMVFLHMAYRLTILGRFLSPITNKRTDQYGGSLENQARFPLMVADRIKQKCGRDFLIEATVSGSEPPGGRTLEDTIKLAKMFAGHFDLLHLKAHSIDPSHPTGFNPEPTPLLYMAEAIKKSNPGVAVVTVGGYQDPDICEDVIASGKADFIAMARSWISNPDYGRKLYEGRGEDVVPCLRCNGCHRSSYADPWTSVCAVNPTWGLEHKIERMIEPPTDGKKVAVIGGGPAGMEAALIAAGRGHQVTLYEKSDALGGLLKTSNNVSFKWPVRDFKNYLVRQIEKSNIKVCLNTEATAEMLQEEEYDAVLAAVGSEPIVPRIPGVDGKNVVFAKDVFGNEDALAENVVIIGGGEVGVETGMHLAEKGHKVTVLEMLDMLAPDAVPIHYYSMFKEAWEKLKNFKYILRARCNGIGADKVTYLDAGGAEHAIKAGSVVVAVGMKPKNDLALEFYGAGDRFFMIGDCNIAGNVQKAMRSAFSTASTL
jgi:2,4-dienoyl-CoA reductase-like NADH-dependent reductase (Old Yellow Enzyme family)/NADPH-dependent 2,4-dienoyl-CoA reductase/sulfur reductase-like enzyme